MSSPGASTGTPGGYGATSSALTRPIAAMASLLRGRRYVHEEHGRAEPAARAALASGDDLEGGQGGVLRVGDPAPVGRHLAQRR